MPSRNGDPVEIRQRAEARFKLAEQRQTDAAKAMSDLRLARDAEAAKTARLRELRLAKEAADRDASATATSVKRARKPARARTAPTPAGA